MASQSPPLPRWRCQHPLCRTSPRHRLSSLLRLPLARLPPMCPRPTPTGTKCYTALWTARKTSARRATVSSTCRTCPMSCCISGQCRRCRCRCCCSLSYPAMTDRDPMELRGLLPGGSDHPSARVQGRSALSAMEREVMDLGRSAERELGVVGRRLEAGAEGALHGAEMGAERALHGAEWLAGRVARVGGDVGITLLQGEKDLVRRILQSHAHGKRLAIALLAALLAVGVIQFGWPDVWNIAQSLPITVSVLVITVAAFIAGVLVPEES